MAAKRLRLLKGKLFRDLFVYSWRAVVSGVLFCLCIQNGWFGPVHDVIPVAEMAGLVFCFWAVAPIVCVFKYALADAYFALEDAPVSGSLL